MDRPSKTDADLDLLIEDVADDVLETAGSTELGHAYFNRDNPTGPYTGWLTCCVA